MKRQKKAEKGMQDWKIILMRFDDEGTSNVSVSDTGLYSI